MRAGMIRCQASSRLPGGEQEGRWWTNYRSKGRALLALFLFTEVDSTNGPTMIRAGSHLDVPSVLWPYGEEGVCAPDVSSVSAHRWNCGVTRHGLLRWMQPLTSARRWRKLQPNIMRA